jgi:hypothetical protein
MLAAEEDVRAGTAGEYEYEHQREQAADHAAATLAAFGGRRRRLPRR